jgi:hypothetical protein
MPLDTWSGPPASIWITPSDGVVESGGGSVLVPGAEIVAVWVGLVLPRPTVTVQVIVAPVTSPIRVSEASYSKTRKRAAWRLNRHAESL